MVVIISMITSLVVIVFLVIAKEWEIAVGVMGTLLSIGTGVLGYYFGYRSGASGSAVFKPIEPPETPPPEDDDDSEV